MTASPGAVVEEQATKWESYWCREDPDMEVEDPRAWKVDEVEVMAAAYLRQVNKSFKVHTTKVDGWHPQAVCRSH